MSLPKVCFYLLILLLVLLDVVFSCPDAVAQDVLTERYNNARTGSTLAGINTESLRMGWRRIGDLRVDGRVYAQPLVVDGLETASSVRHNVVYVATEHNHVYAFDADTLAPIWDRFLGNNDRTKMGSGGAMASPLMGSASRRLPSLTEMLCVFTSAFALMSKKSPIPHTRNWWPWT